MNIQIDRFESVWAWHRVATLALDHFEAEIRKDFDAWADAFAGDSHHCIVSSVNASRDELDNFVLLSTWAIFEQSVNDWLASRTYWALGVENCDKSFRLGLLRRIEHWTVSEKIDALKPLLGNELIEDLHCLRRSRDWVAHRKSNCDKPRGLALSSLQLTIEEVLNRMSFCSQGELQALSVTPT